MPPPGANLSLDELGKKLSTEGPVKQEPARRRVRGFLNGVWVFDTLDAQYVWEHPYFPYFYIPVAAMAAAAEKTDAKIMLKLTENAGYACARMNVVNPNGQNSQAGAAAIIFYQGPLKGLVKVYHTELDAWYIEDEKILGTHPKDPYKRIDCYNSSREIRIEVDGTVVAQSTNNVFLYETGLRTRYYLQPTSILDQSLLLDSKTSTACPYKGEASYYHLKVGDRIIEDAIWYYAYPTSESAPIQNRLCFYNEKVDVFVDDVKEEK